MSSILLAPLQETSGQLQRVLDAHLQSVPDRATEIIQIYEQGWSGLIPILPYDAKPAPDLTQEQIDDVIDGRGKAPGEFVGTGWKLLYGWRTHPDDEATVERWASWPGVNVGLRGCHGDLCIVSIDADILDPAAAAQVRRALVDRLRRMTGCGLDLPYRVGRAPKFAIPVRLTEQVRKFKSTIFEIDGQDAVVEFIGAGGQLVIWGTHPSGKPYEWPLDGPGDIDPAALPLITPDQLQELKGLVEAELAKFGTARGGRHGGIRSGNEPVAQPLEALLAIDPFEAAAAAQALQNHELHYDDWIARGYAICGALGPKEGRDLFWLFSSRSEKFNEKTTRQAWAGIVRAVRGPGIRSGWKALYGYAQLDGWRRPPHPAQALIDRIVAEHKKEQEKPLPVLPGFPEPQQDVEAAVAELKADIAGRIMAAHGRIMWRVAMEKEAQDAKDAVEFAFLEEYGVAVADALPEELKKKLVGRKGRAGGMARKQYIAEHGPEPRYDAHLFNGSQGCGKTDAIAETIAKLEGINILVLLPTIKKCDEVVEELRRLKALMPFIRWRGRTHEYQEPGTEPRLCVRPKRTIEEAQRQGIDINSTVCATCPHNGKGELPACGYKMRLAEMPEDRGRIIVAAHPVAFIGSEMFQADLVVIDETMLSHLTAHERIEPELLLAPEIWAASGPLVGTTYKDTALAVARALQERGQELAHLRTAGISDSALGACAGFLDACHDEALIEAKELLAAGKDSKAHEKMREVARRGYRALARLFRNLREELSTLREGTNGTRLAWVEVKEKNENGEEQKVMKLRYAVDRRREHKLGQHVELIFSDGTGSAMLNQKTFRRRFDEHRYSIEKQLTHIQFRDHTNSKFRLQKCEAAEKNRAEIGQLIRDMVTLFGSVMVGSSKSIKEALQNEGWLDGVMSLHFGAERGINAGKDYKAILGIGREQPSVAAVEAIARALMVDDLEPFVSVLDGEGRGEFVLHRRRFRMRDGSEEWGKVLAHPHPLAQAVFEQIREAGMVQLQDRVRAIWEAKVGVTDCNIPMDATVDILISSREGRAAFRLYAQAKIDLEGKGWAVVRNSPSRAEKLNNTLIRFLALEGLFQVTLPGRNGKGTDATLLTSLPVELALKLAAEEHPGIKMTPPEGGIVAECMRRFGLVPSPQEIQRLLPAFLPDDAAMRSLENEAAELKRLRSTLPTVRYRVAGRRGRPSLVSYDPDRITDIATAMVEKFGAGVTVELPEEIEMEQRKELPAEMPVEQKGARPLIGRPLDRRPRRRTDGRRIIVRPVQWRAQKRPDLGEQAEAIFQRRVQAVPDHHNGRSRGHPFRRLEIVRSRVAEQRKPTVAAE